MKRKQEDLDVNHAESSGELETQADAEIILVNKPIGFTPLKCIEEYRKLNPYYLNAPIGYAGRLDPMARGLLVLLRGEARKKQKQTESLKKEYQYDMLVGVSSDSYDVLGMPTYNENCYRNETHSSAVSKIVSCMSCRIGVCQQAYPPYSSQRIKGKPLFQWTKEGKYDSVKDLVGVIPVTIYSTEFICAYTISKERTLDVIRRRITCLKDGDFRQDDILREWALLIKNASAPSFLVCRFCSSVSSGTYIRSLVHSVGLETRLSSCAFDIYRKAVDDYRIEDSVFVCDEQRCAEDAAELERDIVVVDSSARPCAGPSSAHLTSCPSSSSSSSSIPVASSIACSTASSASFHFSSK